MGDRLRKNLIIIKIIESVENFKFILKEILRGLKMKDNIGASICGYT